MKTKKYPGIAAVCAIVCGLLIFNFLIFPNVLATSPKNSGIVSIETQAVPPPVIAEQPDLDNMPNEPDINAISEEQAIKIAKDAIPERYSRVNPITGEKEFDDVVVYESKGAFERDTTEFYDIRYLDSNDPASYPSWFVLFSSHTVGEKYEYIPGGYTPEEYLKAHQDSPGAVNWECRLGKDDDGETVVILKYEWTTYAIVEVNALTGESNYWGNFGAQGGGVEKAFHDDDLRLKLVQEVLPVPENGTAE